MLCELVQAQTSDLARLHGALFRAAPPSPSPPFVALILSGLAGNFYSSRLLHSVGRQLIGQGIDVLHANTRGHDGLNWLSLGGRTVVSGAAFERVDECRHDVSGWVRFLESRSYDRIAVVGHSLGAIKALFAQSEQPEKKVRCIAALSASRLNHDRFLASVYASRFAHWMRTAQSWVDQGSPETLMRVDFPFPAFIAADAYLHKYGPENRFDWTGFIQRIDRAVLLVFGERELQRNAAFLGIIDEVERLRQTQPQLEVRVVPSADHFYVGRRQVVSRWTAEWVARQLGKHEASSG